MEEKFLENVFGYSLIKEELKLIHDWYLDTKIDEQRRSLLPRGILFYGYPGEGKTHLVREYAKTFGYPVFVIEGNEDNVQDEVVKTYQKAKAKTNAIVVVDELDKLVCDDKKLTRILMAELDGFNKNQSIITLATSNTRYDLPEALLRDGRFDRKFRVSTIDKDDFRSIILGFSKQAGLVLSQNEVDELVDDLFSYSPSEIKSIFNNVALRYGDKTTIDDIYNTADFLSTGFIKKDEKFEVKRSTAVHEAGHAIFIHKYSKYKKFMRVYFDSEGGKTVYKDNDVMESDESRIDNIRSALAGIVAEELIYGKHDIGCGGDLEKAYETSFRLVNRSCIFGIDSYCSEKVWCDLRKGSEYSKTIFDKRTNKFLKENYRYVKKCLKKEIYSIQNVADYLVKRKEIKRNKFVELIKNKGNW